MEFSSFRNAIGMYPEVNEGAFHLPGCRPPGSWLGHSIQARLSGLDRQGPRLDCERDHLRSSRTVGLTAVLRFGEPRE